ncbi:MAG TPA: VOC family protein [Actinomycetales bacterium]|nr:VOC family protein [Actinomycetales bacterium]
MFVENVVMDAVEPAVLGRFWEAVVRGEQLTDEPEGYETRLAVEGGPVLDLCFQRVPRLPAVPSRLRLDVVGGERQTEVVDRLVALGARRLDDVAGAGGDAGSVVLADLEGNPFRVTGTSPADGTGPLAALRLDCADPDEERHLWTWVSGWAEVPASSTSLRHRSGRGPVLELRPEPGAKGDVKNRVHLDVRLEASDDPDEVAAGIAARGGRELHLGWGTLPWRHFADASGNEFCLLPAPVEPERRDPSARADGSW